MQVKKRLIPTNFTKGRGSFRPFGIVLHVMEGSLSGSDSWFRNARSGVSTHYGVGKNGEIWQWVEEEDTAYGNGRVVEPTWPLIRKENPNLYTVSIEHEGFTGQPWTDAMYRADVELIKSIAKRWDIPIDRDHIVGHCQIYAKKPLCPGVGLDWSRLMAMLLDSEVKGKCVKTEGSPDYWWVDFGGTRHRIKAWDTFAEYFKGEPSVVTTDVLEGLIQGKEI